MPLSLWYLAGWIWLMAGSEECFRNFFISVNTNKWFQRSMQRETCLSHAEPYSPEESCSSIEPCSFWALEMVVVQWEGTREMCHQVFEGYKGQIQVWFSDCSVLGLAPTSSSSQACLCPQQWFVWPLLLWVLMILSSIKQLLWNVLCHVMLFFFLDILGISIQMAFPELGQTSSFSRGRTPFLELKHYFLRKPLTCS